MNFNSIKQTIIFLIIGALIVVLGAFFKVMHYQLANFLLVVGLLFEVVFTANILRVAILKKD